VYALDAVTGDPQWEVLFGAGVVSSPTVWDGTVFVGSSDNNVYALDAGESVDGSSEGSRVNLGTLGHHHRWDGTDPGDPSPGTVTGSVTDVEANPLSGADVEFVNTESDETEATVSTDGNGEYTIDLPAGTTYQATASKDGYESEITTVSVTAGDIHTVNFTLLSGNSQPSASFTVSPENPTVGESFTLDASPSDDPDATIETYEWDVDDDGQYEKTGQTITHTVDSAGDYPIRLRVTDDGGASDSDTTVVTVTEPPEEGRIRGEVTVPGTDEEINDGMAYLIDPVHEGDVVEYVDGEEPLPETAGQTNIETGAFMFDEIDSGPTLVLVDPPDPLDPMYEVVSVPTQETTHVSFTVRAERHLSPLDPEIDRLIAGARDVLYDSTDDVAEVYVDAAQVFSSERDKQDYLDFMLSTMSFALGLNSGSVTLGHSITGYIGENTAIPLAEHGLHQAVASRVRDVENDIFQDELKEYVDLCLAEDWLVTLQHSGSESVARDALTNTPMYQDAQDQLNNARTQYDSLAIQEPADDFSLTKTKQVLQIQARWLENNGAAPGVVFTPRGNGYVTREAKYHSGHYFGLKSELETTELLNTLSKGVVVAGKATATVTAASGVGAVVGSVAAVGGWAGSMVFSTHQVYLQNQLAAAWADSLIYWVSDLKDAAIVPFDILGWLEEEMQNPQLEDVNGEIVSTDIGGVSPPLTDTTFAVANEPDYPPWWVASPLPTPQWRRRAINTVTVQNTGTTTSEFQVINIDTYGDGQTEGVSDAVSLYPNEFDEGPGPLDPGATHEVEIEYTSDFQWHSPFNWHYMTTSMWMNGKAVDTVKETYYIVPSLDLISLSEQSDGTLDVEAALAESKSLDAPLKTRSYLLTDGSKTPGKPLTVEDWTENVGDIQQLIEDTVSPTQASVASTYRVPTNSRGVVFVLGSPPDADLNLHVYDEAGRHVGYDPDDDTDVVEIPNTEYNGHESTVEIVSIDEATGGYDVEVEAVRFIDDEMVPVSVATVDIPQRDAILGVSPAVAGTILEPDATATTQIEVSETGNQQDITVTDVSMDEFETQDGDPLEDVTVSVSHDQFSIPAGETETIKLTFDAASTVDLPEGLETRFWADLTIQTAEAGTAVVETSVFVFETGEDVRLTEAGVSVEGVSVSGLNADTLPEPPENVTVTAAYEVEMIGEGAVVLSFPIDFVDDHLIAGYRVENDEWHPIDVSVGERAVIDIEAPGEETIALALEEIGAGPPPIVGDNPPQDLTGDGLYRDINGDGEFTIGDVQAFFQNRESAVIQNNPEFFNFDGSDPADVTIADVQALFLNFVEQDASAADQFGDPDLDTLDADDIASLLRDS